MLGVAQVSDPVQQAVIEQLKGVVAALERLEKSNNLLIVLNRIQIDESRLATLEAQRQGLLTQEKVLTEEISSSAPSRDAPSSVGRLVQVGPGGDPVVGRDTGSTRYADATRKLDEVRRNLRSVEQSITTLRGRVAAWEKRLEEAER
jgi:hypothetical protein